MPTEDRIRELVDLIDADAPPLSDEQADAVATLLTSAKPVPHAPPRLLAS